MFGIVKNITNISLSAGTVHLIAGVQLWKILLISVVSPKQEDKLFQAAYHLQIDTTISQDASLFNQLHAHGYMKTCQ